MRWSTPKTTDQPDLDDEGDAEEEGEPAQAGVAAAPLEHGMIEAVEGQPDQEEHRHQQRAGQQRVHPVLAEHVDAVGTQHQEGRMRDVRHVEQPEGDRQPDAHRRVEAAQQQAGDERLDQQLESACFRPGPRR